MDGSSSTSKEFREQLLKFDWYSTTLDLGSTELVQTLVAGLERAGVCSIDKVEKLDRGRLNWGRQDVLRDAIGQPVAAVLHGGLNAKYGSHVVSSGFYADLVAPVIRDWWPDHHVARVDVAFDATGPGTWDKFYNEAREVKALWPRLSWKEHGDFREERDPLVGRTVELGKRKESVAFARLYEKGKQLLTKTRPGDDIPDLDHCRFELEVKPQEREAKLRAARCSKLQLMGVSNWSRAIFVRLCGLDVERVLMSTHRESDAERTARWVAVNFRRTFEEVISRRGGDPASLLELFLQEWAAQDARELAS